MYKDRLCFEIWNAIIDSYHVWPWSFIKFDKERQKYTVMASNKFFAICRKPFNLRKGGTLYTVIDWVHKIRWTENLLFWPWVSSQEQCNEMLERLTLWETSISQRNYVPLIIHEITLVHKKLDRIYTYSNQLTQEQISWKKKQASDIMKRECEKTFERSYICRK